VFQCANAIMKCRELTFYIDPNLLDASMTRVVDEVLPRFLGLSHFRGYVALESDHGSRRKVIVLSFWNDHLEESEAASLAFVDAVFEVTGTNPTRQTFELLSGMLIDFNGENRIEIS